MSSILRAIAFAAALVPVFAFAASSASAVTWHNDGDTAFVATAGPVTYSSTGLPTTCTGSDTTGTMASAPFTGPAWPAATLTSTYTGCAFFGTAVPLECTRTFTAQAQPVAGTTTGILDTTCRMYEFGIQVCHLEGSVPATYINPVPPVTPGRFTLPTSAGLRTTHSTGLCSFFGSNQPLHFPEQTFTVSSATGGPSPHLGPAVTRTP